MSDLAMTPLEVLNATRAWTYLIKAEDGRVHLKKRAHMPDNIYALIKRHETAIGNIMGEPSIWPAGVEIKSS